jgi:hypothetical protein
MRPAASPILDVKEGASDTRAGSKILYCQRVTCKLASTDSNLKNFQIVGKWWSRRWRVIIDLGHSMKCGMSTEEQWD